MTIDNDREEAHAQLTKERWAAHRELHAGQRELSDQKWSAHDQQHEDIARNLTEYKAQSNEWRQALSDMRSTFTTKSEIDGLLGQAEGTHGTMLAKIDALEADLVRRYDELRGMIANEREERRDQQNLRIGAARGMSQTSAIIVAGIGVVATILGGISLLVNLVP